MPSAEVKREDDHGLSIHQGPLVSLAPSHRKPSPCGRGHPGPQEFTQVSSPPHPFPMVGLEERSALLSLLTPRDSPKPGTHGPPPTHLHFKENPLHMFPIHLHFNSPWGGRKQGALPPSPHPHWGLESMCPLQDQGAVKAQPLHPGGRGMLARSQVSDLPWGNSSPMDWFP